MRTSKIYLRNKIVYNFITDVRNFINKFFILNQNFITYDSIKTHIN